MNICLINPPQIVPQAWGPPAIFQPLGLAYIAAVLERNYEVHILDAHTEGWKNLRIINDKYYSGLTIDEIGDRIKNIRPQIVGISVPFSTSEKIALEVAEKIKRVDRNIIIILGGPHPSALPLETLSCSHVDFVVIGEGEYSTLELVEKLDKYDHKELQKVKGIGYKRNGRSIITPPRDLIEDLSSLPLPARHLLPMEKYFTLARENRESRYTYTYSNRWASVVTSRGCPFQCVFCSIHLTMGKRFRARSPENVIHELSHLVHSYNIKHINFEDDAMTLNKHRFERICELIVEKNLRITWSAPNGIRGDTLDETAIKKMKWSGCKRVFVAPESGVQRVVNNVIKKKLDLKKVEKSIVTLKRYGIKVDGSFVIGFIGETKSDILSTIRYALKLRKFGMSVAGFHIATPLYGTELYRTAKQKGYLKKIIESSMLSTRESLIETPQWTAEEIRQLREVADLIVNFKFYFIGSFLSIIRNFLRNPQKFVSALVKPQKFIQVLTRLLNLVRAYFSKRGFLE